MSTPDGAAPARLRVLTAVVEDHPGVLTRVAGMIRRRGFNIQGLSVGPTDESGRSRMTLTVDAGHAEVDQVQKQLDRLIEVIAVEDLTETPKLSRELALVKLAVSGPRRDRAVAEVDRFGGRVVDVGAAHVIVEVSGEFDRVESFLEALRPYGMVDIARSGPVAMSKEVRQP
ncbi:MAG TPA: acetolactate synthase small subunit [Candidatus Dormibacteraeota bacterium]|nr:acetolactate synthase small subunit [Candidatus Dormibacteraeota bacterium]